VEYPCAYCCCVPWGNCKHGEGRGTGVRGGKGNGERDVKWIDERLWERREHQCGCEDCRLNGWKRWQRQQERANIADYRCDGIS
jgi:hypothetical protein